MEIVKKNLMSIIFGVIALAAVVTAFFPLGGFWTTLQESAKGRAGKFDEAKDLASKERNLPVVTPTGEPKKLEKDGVAVFPNTNVIEAAKVQLGIVKENSEKFLTTAVQASERKPLVENVLPGLSPNPPAQIAFRRRYVEAMNTTAQNLANSMPGQVLHAGTPPTADDVAKAAAEERRNVEAQMLQKGPGGQELNRPAVDMEIQARTASLFTDLQLKSAEKCMVYVNPAGDSLTVDLGIVNAATSQPPEPTAIFWAQIGYWVQEEFCKAVFEVNSNAKGADGKANAKNVLEAPIKHVIRVVVPPGFTGASMMPAGQAMDPNTPPATGVPFDRAAALTKDFLVSPTGRKSGGIIDVVLYNVEMIVEVERLPYVLEAIGHNRYLTVAMVQSITPVDPLIQKAQGFLYGEKPCVRVSLQLEQVFMREWLLKYMPPLVMSTLGVAPAVTAAPTP